MSSWGVVMGEELGWGMMMEESSGWRKGPWTAEEDKLLIEYVKLHGEGRWNSVARLAGLKRNGKSCRLRWVNYLRPDLKRGQITPHEESIILELHGRWGNRWSTIARSLPGRTDNEIKNYWRTHFKKKAKLSSDDDGKSKARLLRRQQFQLQQQQQQQQKHQFDMKKIMSWFDESENRVPNLPQVMRQEVATTLYPNTGEEQGYFCSMLNSSASVAEAPNDDIYWDGLWNLDDVHGNFGVASATTRANLQSFATPLF